MRESRPGIGDIGPASVDGPVSLLPEIVWHRAVWVKRDLSSTGVAEALTDNLLAQLAVRLATIVEPATAAIANTTPMSFRMSTPLLPSAFDNRPSKLRRNPNRRPSNAGIDLKLRRIGSAQSRSANAPFRGVSRRLQRLDPRHADCTRGPNFPLSRLETRLMCPACESRGITVVFEPPTNLQVGGE